jgi:hypothetical protein
MIFSYSTISTDIVDGSEVLHGSSVVKGGRHPMDVLQPAKHTPLDGVLVSKRRHTNSGTPDLDGFEFLLLSSIVVIIFGL